MTDRTKNHVMVDIETYGLPPNGALLQIGACVFDPFRVQTVEELLVDTFLVSVRKGYYDGLKGDDWAVDQRTVDWWATQPEEAQEALNINLVSSPREALLAFAQWLGVCGFEKEYRNSREVDQVWANPPTFDLAILNHGFDVCELPRPWHYRQEKDARTMMWLAVNIPNAYQGLKTECGGLVKHRGDHDAVRQALYVQHGLTRLNRDYTA